MAHPVKAPKKLIEVALPLDAINVASAREKSIRHGHPSTLHLWWARRPLAAARAVIFGQMVNDPSWKWEMEHSGETPPNNLKASWAASRKRLFSILEDLVKWESTTDEEILEKARAEIRKSWRETCALNKDHPQAAELFNPQKLPALHDPFAGGGSIPLEAQRLGLEAHASDLNPVAVLNRKSDGGDSSEVRGESSRQSGLSAAVAGGKDPASMAGCARAGRRRGLLRAMDA
jgi:putative DNA methylase